MTYPGVPLHPDAWADLQKSGLSPETVERCRIESVCPRELAACGMPGVSHALVFPYFALDGSLTGFVRWKLFYSGDSEGKPKYWQPKGTDPEAYLAPLRAWTAIALDPTVPLTISEGEKKGIAGLQIGLHCLGIAGVWNWRAKLDNEERLVLPTLEQFLWQGRPVELVPDSDAWRLDKEADILRGFYALGHELKDRGAAVSFVELPEYNGVKCGLDDFIVKASAFPLETFQGCKRYALNDSRFKRLAAWHQKWLSRQRDSGDKGLVKVLADEILKHDHFAKDASGQLHFFCEGVYRPDGEARIARRVKRLLELNGDTARWSSYRAREVALFIGVDAVDLWERPHADVLNVQNGLLNLTTGGLHLHSPEHLSPIQLPVLFDPDATCSTLIAFIQRVLPADCQGIPYELTASAMRGDISDQTAVLLAGPSGSNGKSTLLNLITCFLGPHNVSNLPLHRFENDRFAPVRLMGKLANICADLPAEHLDTTSVFKALTGGDRILAERKFQGSFEFQSFARLMFSSNHYPQSKDTSSAFFRRWFVVPFDVTIEPGETIPNLGAQLSSRHELSGMLNRVLAVLPAMCHRGGFSLSESTQVAMSEFREMTDPLAAWLDRFTQMSPDAVVSRKDLLISCNAHAETAGRPPITSKAFCAAVRRLRPSVKDAQKSIYGTIQWVFQGIRLVDSLGPRPDSSHASHDSHHSHYSPQINMEEEREERSRGEEIKIEDRVSRVSDVSASNGVAVPCFNCNGIRFWVSVHGLTVCGTCHPPMNPELVSRWLEHETIH